MPRFLIIYNPSLCHPEEHIQRHRQKETIPGTAEHRPTAVCFPLLSSSPRRRRLLCCRTRVKNPASSLPTALQLRYLTVSWLVERMLITSMCWRVRGTTLFSLPFNFVSLSSWGPLKDIALSTASSISFIIREWHCRLTVVVRCALYNCPFSSQSI